MAVNKADSLWKQSSMDKSGGWVADPKLYLVRITEFWFKFLGFIGLTSLASVAGDLYSDPFIGALDIITWLALMLWTSAQFVGAVIFIRKREDDFREWIFEKIVSKSRLGFLLAPLLIFWILVPIFVQKVSGALAAISLKICTNYLALSS